MFTQWSKRTNTKATAIASAIDCGIVASMITSDCGHNSRKATQKGSLE